MTLLVAKEIHKTYTTDAEPLEVLKGVSLELGPGSALAVLGASGAGKSTLLHCMGTLDPPSRGEVFFEGQSVYRWPETRLAAFRNRTIGFVFQFHHLLPMLTALENTQLPLMIAGETQNSSREKARRILDQVGLSGRLGHRPQELSGGEQQRVAIARALALEPPFIFADEPTGNLDSKTGKEVADLLLELQGKTGCSLVVVTHNEDLADSMGQKVYLKDGKLSPS
ncbi:MAG: ABC transporter ATP-binding protein [bacterium]|nr:ABC transporter ATP-binding protein [bacterium]